MEYSSITINLLLPLLLVSSSFSSLAMAITFRVDRSACSSVLVSLSPCSSALASSSSSNSSPSSSCCEPLESVLSNATQFNCLCSLLGNPQYQSMLQSALRLPQLCHLSIVTSEANCTTLTSSSNNGSKSSLSLSIYESVNR